ncbi:dolichyl-P-Man:Man(7)GlcNAc(2)-PP-dolichol alpha-1,6-mannosyltransferase [Mortierella antarctica]|nr:dolichyl-P-Man:Man(7)GlcNAc(2)-PP-dolichol alpha-1,6-mannosyltransferase [Mortierella antarctica]
MATSEMEEVQQHPTSAMSSPKSSLAHLKQAESKHMNGYSNGYANGHANGHIAHRTTSINSQGYRISFPTDTILNGAVLGLIFLHVLIAPYTKVEESFNLQATHDILTMGISDASVQQYDHLFFPGVVPRTFVGPLLLAAGSWPIMALARLVAPLSNVPKGIQGQVIVRLVLGLFSFLGWYQMSKGIRSQFGKTTSQLFMVVSSCQFHWLFYAGRTLPNTFALCIVNVAYSYWMQASQAGTKRGVEQKLMRMLDCLVISTILFRSEVLILLGPIVLLELIMTRIGFWRTVQEGITAGLLSIAVAVLVDSWFWRQWMWAEGAVFWFNAIEGKSVAWGVSPWYTYFTLLLPKIATVSLPLALVATVIEPRFRRYMLPATVFVSLYSLLGHKEWRFVIYVVPILNLGAAVVLSWVFKRKTILYKIVSLGLISVLFLSFIASLAQSLISSQNYPGGVALQRLHELELESFRAATVHIDGAAAETGCSRFGEIGSDPLNPRKPVDFDTVVKSALLAQSPKSLRDWTYSKDEAHKAPRDYLKYTHLLTADPEFHKQNYVVLEQVNGYSGIRRVGLAQVKETCPATLHRVLESVQSSKFEGLKTESWRLWQACSPVQIKTEGRIWIMKRYGAV